MADDSSEALQRARTVVVHEMATVWNIMTNGLFVLRKHITDPEVTKIFEDMVKADTRGRALFDSLRRLF